RASCRSSSPAPSRSTSGGSSPARRTSTATACRSGPRCGSTTTKTGRTPTCRSTRQTVRSPSWWTGSTTAWPAQTSAQLRHDLPGAELHVVHHVVAEVEHLQAGAFDPGPFAPTPDALHHLVRRPGQTVLPELIRLPTDRRGARAELRLVPADDGHQGGRSHQARWFPAGLLHCGRDPLELLHRFLRPHEGDVELGGEPGHQGGGPALAPAADDHRRTTRDRVCLHRLRERG